MDNNNINNTNNVNNTDNNGYAKLKEYDPAVDCLSHFVDGKYITPQTRFGEGVRVNLYLSRNRLINLIKYIDKRDAGLKNQTIAPAQYRNGPGRSECDGAYIDVLTSNREQNGAEIPWTSLPSVSKAQAPAQYQQTTRQPIPTRQPVNQFANKSAPTPAQTNAELEATIAKMIGAAMDKYLNSAPSASAKPDASMDGYVNSTDTKTELEKAIDSDDHIDETVDFPEQEAENKEDRPEEDIST